MQAINVRGNRFYRLIVRLDESLRKELELYVGMSEADRNKELDAEQPEIEARILKPNQKTFDIDFKRLLREFKTDLELWNFLREHSKSIFGIKNWEIYRRGAESVREISPESDSLTRFKLKFNDLVTEIDEIMRNIYEKELSSREFDSMPKIMEALSYLPRAMRETPDLRFFKHMGGERMILFLKELQNDLTGLRSSLPIGDTKREDIMELIGRVNNVSVGWQELLSPKF